MQAQHQRLLSAHTATCSERDGLRAEEAELRRQLQEARAQLAQLTASLAEAQAAALAANEQVAALAASAARPGTSAASHPHDPGPRYPRRRRDASLHDTTAQAHLRTRDATQVTSRVLALCRPPNGLGGSQHAAVPPEDDRTALRLRKAERALEAERRVSEELRVRLAGALAEAEGGRSAAQRLQQVRPGSPPCPPRRDGHSGAAIPPCSCSARPLHHPTMPQYLT